MKQADFWDKIAEKYSASKIGNQAAYEATLDRVREFLKPDTSVLELGCGTGSTALLLADSAGQITGTDISAEMIRIANDKAAAQGVENVVFEQEAAGDAGVGLYDVVTAFNLLHLVDDPAATLANIRNRLPEGGLFISKTPCLGSKPWFVPLIAVMQWIGKAPKPVHSFKPDRLRSDIEAAGFRVEEMMFFPKQNISRFIVARKVGA